jgi:hypothetical protein
VTPAVRDGGIALVLLFVSFQLFAQAQEREPEFTAADIRVVEAPIAEFTTVRVLERAPAPNLNSQQMVGRSAMRLEGYPPNLLAYIPGSGWRFENDIPIGSVVRLEVAEDPEALAARARSFPDATYLMAIEGLQAGDRRYFRAADEIARAEAAARRYRQLGIGAVLAALGWLGWVVWSRRSELRRLAETVREAG